MISKVWLFSVYGRHIRPARVFYNAEIMKRRAFIQNLVISSGTLIIGQSDLLANELTEEVIKVSMIYNIYVTISYPFFMYPN